MSQCNPNDLMSRAACLTALPYGLQWVAKLALLASIARSLTPSLATEPQSIINRAGCLASCTLPAGQIQLLKLQLYCDIKNSLTPPPPQVCTFSIGSVNPTTGSHLAPFGLLTVFGTCFAAGMTISIKDGGFTETEFAVIDSTTQAHATFVGFFNAGTADVSVTLNAVKVTLPAALTIT